MHDLAALLGPHGTTSTAALAALGWVVVRFGYRDVTERPQVCRAQLVALHRQRAGMVPPMDVPSRGMRN